MIKGQKSVRGGIEDFLCPFTDMYITQGANGSFSHQGIMANDVRGIEVGVRYPYYAPCSCRCVRTFPSGGGSMWKSLDKVRFANGRIDYATFLIYHDNSFDAYVGQTISQGVQIGNMGDAGYATGVHCHIEISQSDDESFYKNEYGVYTMNNEYDTDASYFVDNTNIIYGMGGDWKELKDVPVEDKKDNPIYETLGTMYVRQEPNGKHVLVKDLTDDGKAHATSDNPYAWAVYKEGTKFTVYELREDAYSLWGRSPSGWICIKGASGTVYCNEVD